MANAARNKDRALAHAGRDPDVEMDVEETTMAEDGTTAVPDSDANTFSKIIVIHPGSQNLRVGLASDALPKTIPMVVARKSQKNESEAATEPWPVWQTNADGSPVEPKEAFGEKVLSSVDTD